MLKECVCVCVHARSRPPVRPPVRPSVRPSVRSFVRSLQMDVDENGVISCEDLAQILGDKNTRNNPEALRSMILEADLDGDGTVSCATPPPRTTTFDRRCCYTSSLARRPPVVVVL